MNILSLENVSKNYGFRPLFENVTLGLEDRDKIGIIGANGSGKTTLLRIIAGLEVPDSGRVTRAKGSRSPIFLRTHRSMTSLPCSRRSLRRAAE
jgi:ATP-binding cassette subfamily F protein uup